MSAQELRDLSPERQNAVLAATVFHLPHHLTDCVIDRFKKLMGILTRRADNQAAARVTRSGREVQKPLKDVFGSLPCGRDEGQRRGYTDAGLLHLISSNYPFVDDVGHFLRRGDCATERNIGILRHFERAVDAGKIGDLAGPAPHCRRAISLAVNGLEHRLYPFSKALFRRLHRLTIHPGGRALRNPQQIPLHPFARDVMGKRRKAEFRLTPSFRCYMFKSRFHGQLIFPLHERPCLPLNGAHVAQKHFNYR